jgi:hypothetical protein
MSKQKKIVALLPFKNEEWILPTYLSNVVPWVDEIIAIDDQSTDSGSQILSECPKVTVVRNEEILESGWPEYNIRLKLLELGRAAGGTHFVCLDADETFSSNFVPIARRVIDNPGQKVAMQWLALWKSVEHYRDDGSVWSNNFKDFIVYDQPDLGHDYAFLGVGRTPGPNDDERWLRLNPKHGTVFHYQFAHWTNFQLKQAWYRCSELLKGLPVGAINSKYSITLEDPTTKVTEIPESWRSGVPQPEITKVPPSWHLGVIKQWFQEHGPERFAPLQIWHIPEISALRREIGQ